jgi:hypothetical protein
MKFTNLITYHFIHFYNLLYSSIFNLTIIGQQPSSHAKNACTSRNTPHSIKLYTMNFSLLYSLLFNPVEVSYLLGDNQWHFGISYHYEIVLLQRARCYPNFRKLFTAQSQKFVCNPDIYLGQLCQYVAHKMMRAEL